MARAGTLGVPGTKAFSAGAGGIPAPVVSDVFSSDPYTGTGTTQSIVNGINLFSEGGLVWTKRRDDIDAHYLIDTDRGGASSLFSNLTNAASTGTTEIASFNSDGFTTGSSANINAGTTRTYASWTFRKSPRFFDEVTYTGTGSARTVSHSLGQAPGMIIVKAIGAAGYGWAVWHRSIGDGNFLRLDLTNATAAAASYWNNTAPTETEFTVGTGSLTNDSGVSFVAYLFAHDDAADGVIQCGSYTTDGSGNASVTLGWEPQYILFKASSTAQNWLVADTARGMPVGGSMQTLLPNSSSAEAANFTSSINATGLGITGSASQTYVYMTIRAA